MGVNIYNASIHGWADNVYTTPNCILYMFIMPYLLWYLFQAVHPTEPMLWKTTYRIFISESSWRWLLRGGRTHFIPKCLCGKKKPSMRMWMELIIKTKLSTYLVPDAVSVLRVGCQVEGWLR
jgi:hypothetical protein